MLAVKIGHRDELVQNTRLLRPITPGISRCNRFNQFVPGRHAHPPHLCSRGCQPLRNISDEATTDPWGAFLMTQCASGPWPTLKLDPGNSIRDPATVIIPGSRRGNYHAIYRCRLDEHQLANLALDISPSAIPQYSTSKNELRTSTLRNLPKLPARRRKRILLP